MACIHGRHGVSDRKVHRPHADVVGNRFAIPGGAVAMVGNGAVITDVDALGSRGG
jgi:hypothetical protein